jgi:ATP-binding cassette subfamily B protein
MDCGPAALKCLLEGFHIPASYGRLREACQTSIDGTSIDMIETVARQLGLDVEQVLLPRDYLWVPEANALPAMVTIKQPNGMTHFVIVWRRLGRWLQVMDPAVGRRWITCRRLTGELFPHRMRVPAADWHEWAVSSETLQIMVGRLRALGASPAAADDIVARATRRNHWYAMATLDAAVRLLGALVAGDGIRRGEQSIQLLETLVARTAEEAPGTCRAIPLLYWAVLPVEESNGEELMLRGAVLLRVRGRLESSPETEESLAPELRAALTERAVHPMRELWNMIRADGVLTPAALLAALGLAVGALVIEALLFRGLFEVARDLSVASQRAVAFAALLCFTTLLWIFEFPIVEESLRLGRRLETRLRVLLLEKLPRLSDRYFQSRPISDVAERAHSIYLSRQLPDLAARMVRLGWELMFTLLGIAFIDVQSLPLAAAIAILAIGSLIAAQPMLSERDMRARSHAGALHGFYLDALLGIVPIRTHSAELSVRREHEGLLAEWARAARSVLRPTLLVKALQSLVCISLAGWLLLRHIDSAGVTGSLLLLVYWVVKLPTLAEGLATLVAQYPAQRNVALRLLEPIKAPEQPQAATTRKPGPQPIERPAAVAIEMKDVDVVAAGHAILQNVCLSIRPGEHVAVVGPSGAGKSSLLGLLLGWHQAAAGSVFIDGVALTTARLLQLRGETAWLDPAVQLWNRSLLDNLRYSANAGPHSALTQILESADLIRMLIGQPQGLQTVVAEGGASVSGGEGQRLRLARAMWQRNVRLALLDEPFRGLDREQRHRHLTEIRRFWQDSTMICVTHDVGETRVFPRVLVVENGRIVEDGRPDELAAAVGSRYRNLLDVEESLRQGIWNATLWRRVRLDGGRLHESSRVFLTARSNAGHE